jgi:hypothetical protein
VGENCRARQVISWPWWGPSNGIDALYYLRVLWPRCAVDIRDNRNASKHTVWRRKKMMKETHSCAIAWPCCMYKKVKMESNWRSVKNRKCEESCSRGEVRGLCHQEIDKSRWKEVIMNECWTAYCYPRSPLQKGIAPEDGSMMCGLQRDGKRQWGPHPYGE